MAKRGRPRKSESLDGLVSELQQLDQQRQDVINRIRQATDRLLSGENPFPWRQGGRVRSVARTAATANTGRRRRRRRMSKEARAKISAAQKARWAKQKKN